MSQKKGTTILVEEHYARLKQNQFRSKAVLEKEFLERFPEERDFLDKLYVQLIRGLLEKEAPKEAAPGQELTVSGRCP